MKIGSKILKFTNNYLYNSKIVSYKPLLFFRLSIGLFLLIHYLSFRNDINLLFGPERGIFPNEITHLYVDDFVITRGKLFTFFGVGLEKFNLIFDILYISFSVCIILGFFTRISSLIMLFLNAALIKSNVFFSYGVDYFTSMSIFYLIIFPTSASYSLNNLFFKSKTKHLPNYLIYQRFIQLHLCFAYFFSGINKIIGYNWRNGESVWKAINLPYANIDYQINFTWLKNFPIILVVSGWLIIFIELFYPLILLKKIKNKWLIATILMHIGIALVINLYFFSVVMIIWNLAAFYDFNRVSLKNNTPHEL